MARTTFSSRRRPRSQSAARWPGRRILVMSLLTHNPTSTVEQGVALATKKQSFAVRCEEATAGAPKRMRSSRRVALDLPEEIVVWEILVRLPAKEILRCRAVCRSWRGLTSAADFIIAHHRRQPSLPLVVLNGTPATEDGLSISRHSRPVLGFHDYIGFQLHASCDGLLLLLTPSNDRFSICNPATRQCAPLPGLPNSSLINIAALYLHCPSREYRVLYWELGHQATYYILMVDRRGSPRCIGVPSDTPAIEKAMLAAHTIDTTNFAPPIKFRSCLHWDHAWIHHDAGIVVFNTVTESFRFMHRPAGATSFCTRLSDMEDSIGFSCFDDGRSVVRIWVLQDYEREVWSFKYHVKFPVESLCNLADTKHVVLSHEGDVLVYSKSARHMFQCDNNGKLLQEFRWKSWALDVIGLGHCFKESLVKHEFFPRRVVGQERFFQSL